MRLTQVQPRVLLRQLRRSDWPQHIGVRTVPQFSQLGSTHCHAHASGQLHVHPAISHGFVERG